jgi:metal-responsive CopG/Arc/MetJ family transcriptional regulator
MAIVNFSVPDEVKIRFNKVFQHENKSHIIAELMKQAIEEQERKERRAAAIETLLNVRKKHKKVSFKAIKAARAKGRS